MNGNGGGSVYPQEIRLYARGLYIQGHSLSEVARLVKEQFPRARCNAETIRRWAQDPSWQTAREEVQETALSRQKRTAVETLEKHEEYYQQLIDVGHDALTGENRLRPRSAGEASSLVDTGIRGQRTAMKEIVSLDFMQAVFTIVAEEVHDDETRKRIAVRFRELAEKL